MIATEIGSVVQILAQRAHETPNETALFDTPNLHDISNVLDYQTLWKRVRAVASVLGDHPGARNLIVMDNTTDYVIGLLGALTAGQVAVNLLPPKAGKHQDRLEYVAKDCNARAILTTHANFSQLEGVLPDNVKTILVDDLTHTDEIFLPEVNPESLACLQYTSGSTGKPRGVRLTHGNIIGNLQSITDGWSFTTADKGLSWLPMYHDMGLFLGPMIAIFAGFPMGISRPLSFVKSPDRWLQFISDHGISFSGGPNFCYDLCVEMVRPETIPDLDLSSWRKALNGAEPVRASTHRSFLDKFQPFGFNKETYAPAYGLAEATLVIAATNGGAHTMDVDLNQLSQGVIAPPRSQAHTLVSSGQALPGTELRIIDPQTNRTLSDFKIGEITAKAPGNSDGYWNKDESISPSQTEENWLRTGDLGFTDSQGYLFVTGRIKDIIIIDGRNHAPQDLEETTEKADEAIRPNCVAAFSMDNGEKEEVGIVAEIRRSHAEQLDPKKVVLNIIRQINQMHEVQVHSVWLVRHGQVLKTTSGKVRRSACRTAALDDALHTFFHWSVK